MNIINDKTILPTLSWEDLDRPQFFLHHAFQLELADGEVFYAQEVLRHLPNRRLVVAGIWKEKPVIAKLFFRKQSAQRMQKDVAGIKLMQKNKIPTPALYFQGAAKDPRIQVLLLQRIFNAKSLEQIWQERTNTKKLLPLLKAMVVELATQHVLGLLQHDLHLGNFLLTKKNMYMLDGAQVESLPFLLSKKTSMENLALFISQLGVGIEKYQELLFRHYGQSRGWLLKDEDILLFRALVKKWNIERWQKFSKKIVRNSTTFTFYHRGKNQGVYDNSFAGPEFLAFLENPEAAFLASGEHYLKAGRSATVIKVRLDNQEFVIKRYNLKNVFHFLRRSLRPTRAAESWRLAQKLSLFGVATAKPVAFIEKRFLGFRGKSYYVTQYIAGEHAGHYLKNHQAENEKIKSIIHRIATLLKNLARLEISHGDLKITNILVNEQAQPVLIDLDGTAEHLSLSSLRRTWHKEIKRFLRNFATQPEIEEQFKALLKV